MAIGREGKGREGKGRKEGEGGREGKKHETKAKKLATGYVKRQSPEDETDRNEFLERKDFRFCPRCMP
jgi:hypothetical protein